MTQISIKTNLPIVRQGLEDLTADIPKVGRQRLYRTMQAIQRRMRKPGKAINYPVKWDSEKQRRAFFATNGFGRGIPTIRTDKYVKGWKILKLNDGYRMTNNTGYAKYVGGTAFGTEQSNIHKSRWGVLRDEVDAEIENLPDEIEDDIDLAARRRGF